MRLLTGPSKVVEPMLSTQLLRNWVEDAVRVRLQNHPLLRPLILAYFVTFRCNLRCLYCDYASQEYAARYPDAPTAEAMAILRICREGVPAVAFSGGEPLLRDDIVELLRFARSVDYRPISLFTNSLMLPQREQVLDYIDFLQVSLDTLNGVKQDALCGRPGVGSCVKENIERYARMQTRKHFRMNINAVIGVHNLDEVPVLLDFARRNDVRLTVCPQLDEKGEPIPALRTGETAARYSRAIQALVDRKPKDRVILDLMPFLMHIAAFRSFRCFPALAPRVYPDGTFIYPCPRLSRRNLKVLQLGSWRWLIEAAGEGDGVCEGGCFLPCFLETSLLVTHPFSAVRELT